MTDNHPENIEKVERSDQDQQIERAEIHLRSLERQEKARADVDQTDNEISNQSRDAKLEEEKPFDTADEWWNKQDNLDDAPTTLTERAKQIAVIGLAGATVLGRSLMLGQEALQQSADHASQLDGNDIMQSQVIEQPADLSEQFVESDAQISLDQSAFADLQTEELASAEASTSADIAAPVDAEPSVEIAQGQWWYDVPAHSQHGLVYNGDTTAYGCTPASTKMVLDYWHLKDPQNKTLSAQELLDANVIDGEFHRTGMSPSNIHDEVQNLGYSAADHPNADFESLKQAVSEGPVVAVVKLGMAPEGNNHAVVVTGISENNEVRVNDPWSGEAHTYSQDQFARSWGADFGQNAPRNSFVAIRPK